MITEVSSYSQPYMKIPTGQENTGSAGESPFNALLKDSQSALKTEEKRPAAHAAVPAQFSDYAIKMMGLRDVDSTGIDTFKDILTKAVDKNAYSDPKAFLKSLSPDEMEVLRQVHSLAEPIRIDPLDIEGAYNLLLQPGDAKDLNNDGLLGVGIGKGWVFPPPNASPEVKKAWDEATADLSDGEKMLAMTPFMTMQISANIKYGADGNAIGIYQAGEPGYTNIFAEPGFSYTKLIEKALAALEFSKSLNSTEHY